MLHVFFFCHVYIVHYFYSQFYVMGGGLALILMTLVLSNFVNIIAEEGWPQIYSDHGDNYIYNFEKKQNGHQI